MYKAETRCLELKGTNYEIGLKIGNMIAGAPGLKAAMTAGGLNDGDAALAKDLFDRWCPGLNEEILGLADALGVSPKRITFYAMTYLKPACSQIAVPSVMTVNRHVLMARSYEFSPGYEDFTLARTSVKGKYMHIGSTVMQLGRDEGLNEHGLGITMSSCGFPVGTPENMRRPALRGLQFWAVIRALLENCKDLGEALLYIKDMPIAYNINMLLADKDGRMALVETLDGRTAVKEGDGAEPMFATNYALLPGLARYETSAMRNSLVRYETIREYLDGAGSIDADKLKTLLLKSYPEGLCCHDYDSFFGTTKSIVMDISGGTLDICWGGLAENGWKSYSVREPLYGATQRVKLMQEEAPPDFYNVVTV